LAVSLLDFAINPRDFGQTVENLFYISFLVREGNAKIIKDEEGLPLLSKSHDFLPKAPDIGGMELIKQQCQPKLMTYPNHETITCRKTKRC
jgi:hypothetical protein